MNKEEIKKILPHREPMLLVEQVDIAEDGSALGHYTVRGDEFFLQGHFPDNPVVPGVILCEMVAQASSVLLAHSGAHSADKTPFFTKLDKVKFRRPVRPGETVELRCRITHSKGPFYFGEGTAGVGGETAMSCAFSFALVEAGKAKG